MTIFEANISSFVVDFFKVNLNKIDTFKSSNIFLNDICGIKSFFHNSEELTEFKSKIEDYTNTFEEPNRRAYGDFQTNKDLANNIVKHLIQQDKSPELLIEPTCGKGRFVIAALEYFQTLKKVIGIEIYYPYVWETKLGILELYLKNKSLPKVEIEVVHEDIFDFDFANLTREHQHLKLLVLGNPPWVTNSELGTLEVKNLPQKSNFKNHSGIDAITGKGNFDIAEYISLKILKYFDK